MYKNQSRSIDKPWLKGFLTFKILLNKRIWRAYHYYIRILSLRIFHYLWSLLSDSLDQIKYSFLTTLMRMIQFWGDLRMDFFRFFCEYHFSSLLATFIPYNFPLSIQIIANTYLKSGTWNSNHLPWFIVVDDYAARIY